MNAVFDTNILIDYLLGHQAAKEVIGQFKESLISIITKMEVLVGATKDTEEIIREFLESFTLISLNEEIAEIAITIKKEKKIRLQDAIVWATAKYHNSLLITRNTKDFPIYAADIKVPYNI